MRGGYNQAMCTKTMIAAVIATALLAGCASSSVTLHTTNSPSIPAATLPPGSSYSSAVFQADVSPGTYISLFFFGYLLSGMQDDYRRLRYGPSWRKPPEMAEGRSIVETDCSQPVEQPYANLRCK